MNKNANFLSTHAVSVEVVVTVVPPVCVGGVWSGVMGSDVAVPQHI